MYIGGMWLQKPILATTWVALFFCFLKKHVPGILGRVLVISNTKVMNILIIYCILCIQKFDYSPRQQTITKELLGNQ